MHLAIHILSLSKGRVYSQTLRRRVDFCTVRHINVVTDIRGDSVATPMDTRLKKEHLGEGRDDLTVEQFVNLLALFVKEAIGRDASIRVVLFMSVADLRLVLGLRHQVPCM